ncbi:MAG: radical SAM family heme chaperone HemW [Syntrophomonas sp.]|uniref:radical SAM family heme chaperone HemW n=1 Tax=Syntrophomonas sp. TaxID=2053627 RepID=UPI00260AECE1|nr:radical SAM family heme chaperone HemW [Syntrophomonas sp.]MDD2510502.1 radical SAM family heme chaperone HemW [Syntrophomonas sp.]MDD3878994.1 radical SAM family heme chaperone HemW [Syntrophomonas sp.]MDD4625939.1 radical SAM family heme chaperone HemW [Syntrophomonas sp.]
MDIEPNINKKHAGIYIHIPFCLKKCGYCDFYSQPLQSLTQLERYATAVRLEIEKRAVLFPDTIISSIYLGGGTPSLLAPQQLQSILGAVSHYFKLGSNAEISLEMNPATVREAHIRGVLAAGVNRISLGIQSFSEDELKILGRVHGLYDIMHNIDALHKEGCKNFNLDLIYGIPGQSLDTWQRSLELAVSCRPQHISTYLLQLDESTPMARAIKSGQIKLLDEESEYSMYHLALDYLPEKGFSHYELSNFCQVGFECRHNLNYWGGGDYIGIGAGAVSCIKRKRYRNRPILEDYLMALEAGDEAPMEILEQMSVEEKMREEIILALRLCDGIDLMQFADRYHIDFRGRFALEIEDAEQKGLLKMEKNRLSLTRRGYFLSNQVFCRFMS